MFYRPPELIGARLCRLSLFPFLLPLLPLHSPSILIVTKLWYSEGSKLGYSKAAKLGYSKRTKLGYSELAGPLCSLQTGLCRLLTHLDAAPGSIAHLRAQVRLVTLVLILVSIDHLCATILAAAVNNGDAFHELVHVVNVLPVRGVLTSFGCRISQSRTSALSFVFV